MTTFRTGHYYIEVSFEISSLILQWILNSQDRDSPYWNQGLLAP
jgi:hypothetical protein